MCCLIFRYAVSVDDPPARQVLWLNKEGEIFVGVKVGYPAPEYLWKKDGVKFDANSSRYSLQPDGTITISSVSAEDDGDYTVRISQLNRRRETTERIKVVVVGKSVLLFFFVFTTRKNVHCNSTGFLFSDKKGSVGSADGYCALLKIERSGFEHWSGTLCCFTGDGVVVGVTVGVKIRGVE